MMQSVHTRDEIVQGLVTSFDLVLEEFESTNEAILHQSNQEKWSIAEQMAHLIQSNFPIASALKSPKERLKVFGQLDRETRTYEVLKGVYKAALASGTAVATGKFLPDISKYTNQAAFGLSWKQIKEKFVARAQEWTEEDLDEYVLIHPALGKLSVREMLFFTIFHNLHHLASIKQLKTQFYA